MRKQNIALNLVNHKPTQKNETAIFLGITSRNLVALLINGQYAFGYGALYSLDKETIKEATDTEIFRGKKSPRGEIETIEAACGRTNKKYRFVGAIKSTGLYEAALSTSAIGQDIEDFMELEASEICNPLPSNKSLNANPIELTVKPLRDSNYQRNSASNKEPSLAELADELNLISAHRNAGFTPYIKLKLVCVLTKESRANIYRKQASGNFPRCIKRGKGSFWNFDDIEKYTAGMWVANPSGPNDFRDGAAKLNTADVVIVRTTDK